MKLVRLLAAAGFAALAVTTVLAQATGGYRVRVVDASDKTPIIGAFVTLENTNHYVAKSTVVTDAQGVALFPVLKPGAGYKITVIVSDYATIQQDLEPLRGGDITNVPIAMAPTQTEVVKVVAKRQTVDLDKQENSTKFNSEFIQDLPIEGRFYQNVLKLAPGVQDPNGDGNPNVNGARTRDFKTEVGGISNVDPLTGKFMNMVPADSIEEMNVITSGAGVEYGRAQGGYATIVQKQGSNDFEGVAGMVYSSKILDGAGATGLSKNELPDFYRYQPNLQVSGPIVRDKLWYRLSQEYIRREDPLVLGSGGSVATTGTDWFSTSNQLTWQVSNRNKLAFQYQADPRTITNYGLSALNPVASTLKYQDGGPTYTLTWSAPYSPRLFVESVVGYQDTHVNFLPTTTGTKNDCLPGGSFLDYAQCQDASNGLVSGSNNVTWKDNRQRLTVRSDATYYEPRLWGMTHQFKFGFQVENERYFRSLLIRPFFLALGGAAASGGGGSGGGTPDRVIQAYFSLQPYSEQRAVGNTWAVYGSDVFRPLSNVSVTLGVRVSQQAISANGYKPFDPQAESSAFLAAAANLDPSQLQGILPSYFIAYEDIQGALNAVQSQVPGIVLRPGGSSATQSFWQLFRQPQNINIHNTLLEPNLAVSWDPSNDGRSKLSFSARRYGSEIFLAIPVDENNPVQAAVTWTSSIARGEGEPQFSPTFSFRTVDRNLKTPYQDELVLSYEHELWQESSIKVSLLRRSYKDQLQDIDINNAPGDYGKCNVQLKSTDPYLVPSPGTGPVVDPYTGKTYMDTDPGNGDGRIDDCVGKYIYAPVQDQGNGGPGGGTGLFVNRPDGYADLYVLNPGWGNIYKIGNYNSSLYNSLTIEFTRRQYKNWQMEASYTLSKAVGNGEDYTQLLGNDRSTLQDEYGYQSYDVRHSVKVNATTITPWGFRLGGAVTWQSGLPYSLVQRQYSTATAPPTYASALQSFSSLRTTYITHRRNDQRNRSYWNVDAKLVKEMNLPKGINLQLTAEIFNLLNDDTYIIYDQFQELGWQVNGQNDAYRRFGRRYQLGVRLAF